MSKENEEKDIIYVSGYEYTRVRDRFRNVLKSSKETIDNANPSEALEALKKFRDLYDTRYNRFYINVYNTIEQALLKSQDQEKVLEIIKKKGIDIGWLRQCNMVEEYNYHCEAKPLTEEEFDLLRRWVE